MDLQKEFERFHDNISRTDLRKKTKCIRDNIVFKTSCVLSCSVSCMAKNRVK